MLVRCVCRDAGGEKRLSPRQGRSVPGSSVAARHAFVVTPASITSASGLDRLEILSKPNSPTGIPLISVESRSL
jgi:hypothetical protein